MNRKRLWVLLMAWIWVIPFLLTSCGCLGGGSGGEAKVETRSTTLGQELMDLDDAYKKGIISEDEYNKKKKALMKRDN